MHVCPGVTSEAEIVRRRRTMADDGVVSEIVTQFFFNTCRLRPQLSRHVIQAVGL